MQPVLRRIVTMTCFLLALDAAAAERRVPEIPRHVPVRSVPTGGLIDRPGVYVLERDVIARSDAPAITIASNDVTLDLNGHTLRGPGQRSGTGVLVRGAKGVRVEGGRLMSFGIGVQVEGAENVRVERLQILGEDLGGAPPAVEIGVHVLGSRGVVVTENTITGTFLGIFVRGAGSGGNRIFANTLTGGANGQLGICYNPAPGLADGPSGDLVYDNLISRWNVGLQTSAASAGNVVRDNAIAYFSSAIEEVSPGSNLFLDNAEVQILR